MSDDEFLAIFQKEARQDFEFVPKYATYTSVHGPVREPAAECRGLGLAGDGGHGAGDRVPDQHLGHARDVPVQRPVLGQRRDPRSHRSGDSMGIR